VRAGQVEYATDRYLTHHGTQRKETHLSLHKLTWTHGVQRVNYIYICVYVCVCSRNVGINNESRHEAFLNIILFCLICIRCFIKCFILIKHLIQIRQNNIIFKSASCLDPLLMPTFHEHCNSLHQGENIQCTISGYFSPWWNEL